MEVNLAKTEIVVFRHPGRPSLPDWQWVYNGTAIQVSTEFKYLGIVFHETQGVMAAVDTLAAAARRANIARVTLGLWRPTPPLPPPRRAPSRRINGDGRRQRGGPDDNKHDDDDVDKKR